MMKKIILYLILYFIIIYEVYFISHYLICLGSFGGDGFMVIYWILHFIFFCFLQYKFLILKNSNKIKSILLIVVMSIIPIYFNWRLMINSSPSFKYKLEEIASKIEAYRKKNGHYPNNLDLVASPLNRFITFPYYFLPFPKYQYNLDTINKTYSMRVYEDWDGCYIISSKEKEAKWLED